VPSTDHSSKVTDSAKSGTKEPFDMLKNILFFATLSQRIFFEVQIQYPLQVSLSIQRRWIGVYLLFDRGQLGLLHEPYQFPFVDEFSLYFHGLHRGFWYGLLCLLQGLLRRLLLCEGYLYALGNEERRMEKDVFAGVALMGIHGL
jgi:hypothetical protein